MIPLDGVITQLKSVGTPFKFVGGALDLVTAGDHLKLFPSAYVLPLADGATTGNQASYGAVVQQMAERFGVMYAVRNVRAGAGDKAQEELRVNIEWARAKVLGFLIDGTRDLVQFEGGDLVSFGDEIAIWNDRFITSRDIRKV